MALPFGFTKAGSLAVPGLTLLGIWNFYNCQQLLRARDAMPQKVDQAFGSAYSAVMHAALGRTGVVVLEGSVCVSLTLVCASLQVQASQLIAASSGAPRELCAIVGGLLLIPSVLLRSLDRLAWLAVGSLLILAISLLAVAASGLVRFGAPTWPPPSCLTALPSSHDFALFFGIASFSFGLQTVLLPVQDGMASPEAAPAAVISAVGIVVFSYALVGVALVWLYDADHSGIEQLILLNLPHKTLLASAANYASAAVAVRAGPDRTHAHTCAHAHAHARTHAHTRTRTRTLAHLRNARARTKCSRTRCGINLRSRLSPIHSSSRCLCR